MYARPQAQHQLSPSFSYASVITAPLPKNRPVLLQQELWAQTATNQQQQQEHRHQQQQQQQQQWKRPGIYTPETSYAKAVLAPPPPHFVANTGHKISCDHLRLRDASQYFNVLRGALTQPPEKYAEWETEFARQNRDLLLYLAHKRHMDNQRYRPQRQQQQQQQPSWRRNPHERAVLMLLRSLKSVIDSMPPGLRTKSNADTCQYVMESLEYERLGYGDRPWLASMERWVDAL